MKQLNFTQNSNGKFVCEFTPSSAGLLVVNREKSGDIKVAVCTPNTTPVIVDSDNVADYAVGINYTDILVMVESGTQVISAEYTGDIN